MFLPDRFWRNRRGNTAVEYAIVLGLIAIACIGSVQVLGRNVQQVLQRTADALIDDSSSASPSPQASEISAPQVIMVAPPKKP